MSSSSRNAAVPWLIGITLASSGIVQPGAPAASERSAHPEFAAFHDVDGDGRDDLVLASAGAWIRWSPGRADGTFGNLRDIAASLDASLPALSVDAKPVDPTTPRILTRLSSGPDGSFGAPVAMVAMEFTRPGEEPLRLEAQELPLRRSSLAEVSAGSNPRRVLLDDEARGGWLRVERFADLDGDARPDLLLTRWAEEFIESSPPSVAAAVSPRPSLGVRAAGRHPLGPDVPVLVTLTSAAPATVEMVDVRGRVIRRLTLDAPGPGEHRVPLGEGLTLRSGIYLVRVTQGRSVAAAKLALVTP